MNFDDWIKQPRIGGGDIERFIRSRLPGWSGPVDCASIEQPDALRDAWLELIAAGAAFVTVCVSRTGPGASPPSAADLSRAAAAAARAAADSVKGEAPAVVGVLDAGIPLLLLNEITEHDMTQAYKIQARALADGGVDALLCRGFSEIPALAVAVRAASDSAQLPVIGHLQLGCGADGAETPLGGTIPHACEALADSGAVMIGACSDHPDDLPALVALMKEAGGLPVWITLNAGRAELVEGDVVYSEPPEPFAERVQSLLKAGATVIEGDRGVTPEHLARATHKRKPLRR